MGTALRCPKCRQSLGSRQPDAEGRIRCDHCGAGLRLKQPKAVEKKPVLPSGGAAADDDDDYQLSPLPVEQQSASSPFAPPKEKVCPKCKAELAEGTVLCVACGYHLLKGVKLDTKSSGQADSEFVENSSKKSRKVLGFLHAGNSVPLGLFGGAIGGASFACLYGFLVNAAGGFELGVYLFVFTVLGSSICGAVGYALTAVLPPAPPKKKKKTVKLPSGETVERRTIWGVNWAQVGTGSLMLFGGGVVSVAVYAGGRIWFFPIVIAFAGLGLLLNGLMGEEGIW